MRLLLADNNDSFTRNLEHLLVAATASRPQLVPYGRLGELEPADYDCIVISPGPGHPREYPCYARFLDSGVPVLGICMGMQIINSHFGGTTGRLPASMGGAHGKQGTIMMEGEERTVARYHSLHCNSVGSGLRITATLTEPNPEGPAIVMALQHENRPLMGYQFHPESFLTPNGTWYIDHALRFFRNHQ
ncbi:aminodeoxychorismate/anthranilate synthase component II [Desulfovibrio mangrovi]|uniref:aminodeoxychorismate/anthranilate synthase component II n=1 Tax=Desulfovibrio mangrovi TaxID=2976983 RepID=UPI002246E8D9|nr:aminodeoxychorismate/anthranilate synthase component II [Desulfovibrio mangrovi]UZP66440.1 aminodeoxychorismate/anthranilate synthase component II [Desulfovibrio mangrovi]